MVWGPELHRRTYARMTPLCHDDNTHQPHAARGRLRTLHRSRASPARRTATATRSSTWSARARTSSRWRRSSMALERAGRVPPGRRPHRPALRRQDVGRGPGRPRLPARRTASWGSAPARTASRRPRSCSRSSRCCVEEQPGRRRRRRRRQLDARLRARRGQARHPGRPRRGRPALVRLGHARGDQPRPHRPAVRPALHAQPRGGRRTCAPRASSRAASTTSATR